MQRTGRATLKCCAVGVLLGVHGPLSLTSISVLVMFVVSLFSQTKSDAELAGLTYQAVTPEQLREVRESWGAWDVVHTAVIIGIILLCYISFF